MRSAHGTQPPERGARADEAARAAHEAQAVDSDPSDPSAFEDEQLVLVDEDDRPLGRATKGACHLGSGRTHRAFATAVFDEDGALLLARRAAAKPLWPGYWDATVASHPREGESYAGASDRRLREELGCAASSRLGARFRYRIAYRRVGVEDELCAGLAARVEGRAGLDPDPREIDALRWASPAELTDLLAGGSEALCPWMPLTLLALERADLLEVGTAEMLTSAARAWLATAPFEGAWRLLDA